jgi:protein tyrosine phosphatase
MFRERADARREGDVLVHCASANRVGAMLALDQAMTQNQPATDAVASAVRRA